MRAELHSLRGFCDRFRGQNRNDSSIAFALPSCEKLLEFRIGKLRTVRTQLN